MDVRITDKKPEACKLTSYSVHGEIESEDKTAVVVVRNAALVYQAGPPILNGLNMTVTSGTIYSLLGSSGCGKTSLLLCILGMKKLHQGNAWVFGKKVGTNSTGVLGRNVGYMPQDISLYGEFTIWETLQFFGTFNGMTQSEIAEQSKFLEDLLQLPNLNRRVQSLSGGQQRRVSFSVALLHHPPLLILDEPTVGVDPLLRQNIWNHLANLVMCKKTTVIITTHYIEEARRSHMIGIIRKGRIISELPPEQLIHAFSDGTGSLEKAVLNLCKESSNKNIPERNKCLNTNEVKMALIPNTASGPSIQQSLKRIKALTRKNFVMLLRNILLLSFVVWIPTVEVLSVMVTYGYQPAHLKLGVINQEVNYSQCPVLTPLPEKCDLVNLSCAYLSHIPKQSIEIVSFDDIQTAESATRLGMIWGYLIIPPQFSSNIFDRVMSGSLANETTLNSSQIIVKLDETNKPITITIKVALYDALFDALSGILSSCGFDPRHGQLPLQYGPPVHGGKGMDFREYTAPGMAIAAMFFFPIITMGTRFVNERKCGMLDRSLIAGVRMWEIIVAYIFSEFFLLVAQTFLVFGVVRLMSDIQIVGSTSLCILLLLLTGYCGISLGFLAGSILNEEVEVAIVALGTFLPNLFLCGMVWPIEGMPVILQKVVNILSCTLSSEAIRSIISRGWELSHENVWPGFLILVIHTLVYTILTILFYKSK